MTTQPTGYKIEYYRTNKGLFVKIGYNENRTKPSYPDESVRINGAQLKKSHHPEWFFVDGASVIESFKIDAGKRRINERYVLKNEMVNGLPSEIPAKEIERDTEYEWTGKYAGLSGAYELKYEEIDLGFEDAPFHAELEGELEIEGLGNPTRFSYRMATISNYSSDSDKVQTIDYKSLFNRSWGAQVNVDEIVKAIQPEFAWHLSPCSLGSETTYRIIRQHVKDHLDPYVAQITSDYNFCFTVKKKIRKPMKHRKRELTKPNGRSYRPPRFKHWNEDHELVEIFEMTNAKEKYRGYTIVEGFTGDNLDDLCDAIDAYLAELMRVINEPLEKCSTCQGSGIVHFHHVPTNKRDFEAANG